MTLSLPFSPVSGVDIGQSMENVCQPFEQQGRWPFGADPNADLSAYTRQRPLAIPGGVGVYNSNMAEVVRYAPGELIEKNAFHLELKLTLAQRDQEMVSLNEGIIAQQKEFDDLKARYETLDGMHRMMIEQFASEYHELKAASGNGPKPLTLVGVLPFPKIKIREACPEIVQWNRDVYLRSAARAKAQKRGETDGNAITVTKKAKVGRPPKTAADDDEDSESHSHFYLENLDGTLINTASLCKLSSKVRSVWFSLAKHGEAPPTWGKVSDIAGEYFYRHVLDKPGLEFLQYCDDGLWKLREWAQQSYSGWAKNHGIRGSQPRQKNASEGPEGGGLNDPNLIRISPNQEDDDTNRDWGNEGHQTTDDADNEENDNGDNNTRDEDAGTSDGNNTPIPAPIPPASVVMNPFAPAPSTTATSGATNALTAGSPASATPREATVPRRQLMRRMHPTQRRRHHQPQMTHFPRLRPSHESLSSCPHGPDQLATAAASVAPAEGNNSDTPPSSERAQLGPNNEKKRKPDDKTPSASTKKQKTSAALAIPSDGNSIKGVCMRRWNELQPGGQGLASDFEEYFKALTKADKEPFKKEMRIIQLANKKAKAIAKTTTIDSNNPKDFSARPFAISPFFIPFSHRVSRTHAALFKFPPFSCFPTPSTPLSATTQTTSTQRYSSTQRYHQLWLVLDMNRAVQVEREWFEQLARKADYRLNDRQTIDRFTLGLPPALFTKVYKLDSPDTFNEWKDATLKRQKQYIHLRARLHLSKPTSSTRPNVP
ncbi:hypothetical protein EDB84DRAFT_1569910 [Lactarius hengduanensis]|nr:hypothetical protein EDB84DRAFT_1569910 [Lactarius hengduanensis]